MTEEDLFTIAGDDCGALQPSSDGPPSQAADSMQAQLQLALLPGVGPRTLTLLLEAFHEPSRALAASRDSLMRVPGIGPKLASTIQNARDHIAVEDVLDWCQQNQVTILQRYQAGYPELLEDLDDTPPFLFARGEILPQDQLAIGIVGTRHCTAYGLKQTERIVGDLARAGITIVSGLARGVDTAAHRAALREGGRTIAFLGGGLGELYPPENSTLADEISQAGAVVSEYSPLSKPRSCQFPQRNRLIAACSLATLVIEAPQRSGSLITARLASELGRQVGAIPGPVQSRASQGCHQLIRDGATLVTNADEVLELVGPLDRGIQRPAIQHGNGDERFGDVSEQAEGSAEQQTMRDGREMMLNDVERLVLDHISTEGTSLDEITQKADMPSSRVLAVVSILEMRRFIRRLSSQYVSRI